MQQITEKFYPLTTEEVGEICRGLTKIECMVLLYLRSCDPYGNGIKVKSHQLAIFLGCSKRAINLAIASLKRKNFISAEETEWSIKINAGGRLCQSTHTVTEVGNTVPTGNNSSQSGNTVPSRETQFPVGKHSSQPELETLSEQSFHGSKINKIIKTLSERDEQKDQELTAKDQDPTANKPMGEESASYKKPNPLSSSLAPAPAPFVSAYQRFEANAHPALIYSENVPWLLPPQKRAFTKFKPEFLDWGAREFLEEFGKKDFYKARADFLSYLKNSPDKIEAKWEQYCAQTTHKAITTVARVGAGIAVSEEEKLFLLENREAIAPLESLKIDSKILNSVIPDSAEMPESYKEFAGDADNFWKKLSSRKAMPAPAIAQAAESDEERWHRWLHSGDPNVIRLAIKQAKAAGYQILYDGDYAYDFSKGGES